MTALCPHCRASLDDDRTPATERAVCPHCGRTISASNSFLDDFPAPLLGLCVAAILVLLFLAVTAAAGPVWGSAVTGFVTVTLLIFWKRKAIAAKYAAWRQRVAEKKQRKAEWAELESEPAENEEITASEPLPSPAALPAVPVAYPVSVPEPQQSPDAPTSAPTDASPVAPAAHSAVEADDFTTGLAEWYRPFLMTAMSRAEWDRAALRQEAQRHRLDFEEALRSIADWSRTLYGDPVLVEQGDRIRVQLPLI